MEPAVIVKNDEYKKLAKQCTFSLAFQVVVFALLWEQFSFAYGHLMISGLMIMEALCTIVMIVLSKGMKILDAGGITIKSPLGQQNYPWSNVQDYSIETFFGKAEGAVIRVVCSSPKKKITIPCREDTLYWVQRYCGAPVCDQRNKLI